MVSRNASADERRVRGAAVRSQVTFAAIGSLLRLAPDNGVASCTRRSGSAAGRVPQNPRKQAIIRGLTTIVARSQPDAYRRSPQSLMPTPPDDRVGQSLSGPAP